MTFAIELSNNQSRRILERACRAHQQLGLLPKSWSGSNPIRCQLVGSDDNALELQVPHLGRADFTSLLNTYCQIDLELNDGQYFFDSHILAARQREDAVCISLAWPESILVKQRRRSSRTALAKSSTVQLSCRQGDRIETFQGQLYNLSEGGLAFKLPRSDAQQIEIGQTCCACFEVPEQDHCYKFQGAICRTGPSSEKDAVIMGMQFDPTAIDQQDLNHLREFLTSRSRCTPASGISRRRDTSGRP